MALLHWDPLAQLERNCVRQSNCILFSSSASMAAAASSSGSSPSSSKGIIIKQHVNVSSNSFVGREERERERERAREFALILYHRSQRAGNCLAVRRFVHEREAVRGNFVFTKALIPSPKRDIVVRSITCVLHDERPGLNPPE